MTFDEQKTWDLLTWANDVDVTSFCIDGFNEDEYPEFNSAFIVMGRLKNGELLTSEQIKRYCEYFPTMTRTIIYEECMYYFQHYVAQR